MTGIKRDWNRTLVNVVTHYLDPSFLMAIMAGLVLGTALFDAAVSPEVQWIIDRSAVSLNVWRVWLIMGALAIVYFKPNPLWTVLLSSGLMWFGWWAFRYALDNSPPFVTVFMLFGMVSAIVALASMQLAVTAMKDQHGKPG